jgi:hypothetical protein
VNAVEATLANPEIAAAPGARAGGAMASAEARLEQIDLDQGSNRTNDAPFMDQWRAQEMSQGEVVYLAGTVISFVVFAFAIFWVERQTRSLSR